MAHNSNERGDYWITAGTAALEMTRIIDMAYHKAAARARDDATLRHIDSSLFRTRLISPAVCDNILDSVLARTSPQAAPSVILRAARLMAGYNGAADFPTSLGDIPDGPDKPTTDDLTATLDPVLDHLLTLPQHLWALDHRPTGLAEPARKAG
ncbi:hypothetical protein [Nocardia sp. N2S4-5]|uniref:hypothetical protein n=1 Tax=Nocardia sp. N2S4-5 TaxID=3351565 RepID=UPI0037D22BE6